jgi:leader peptidase (prepilin peptidase)/N-methyltransferase
MTLELWLWTSYLFLIGLLLGSFFNVVGLRIPNKESLLGRSKCPHCGHTLGVFELIPIVGYLFLKGTCKSCDAKISVKYPIIEFITAFIFAFSFVILHENMLEYVVAVTFFSLLIIVVVSDLEYQIVPDSILLVFAPILIGLRVASDIIPWYSAIIGAIIGFGFMYLIAWYGKHRFKREALGGGDIKLYAIIGFVLGYETVVLSVLLAALLGLFYAAIVRPKTAYVPFVPFIAVGVILTYFVGDDIIEWYMNIL